MSHRKPTEPPPHRRNASASPLEHAINAERALTLGRLGREVEQALLGLRAANDAGDPERRRALQVCADAVWRYFIQREAHGLTNHEPVIEFYAIPRDVLARVGALADQ